MCERLSREWDCRTRLCLIRWKVWEACFFNEKESPSCLNIKGVTFWSFPYGATGSAASLECWDTGSIPSWHIGLKDRVGCNCTLAWELWSKPKKKKKKGVTFGAMTFPSPQPEAGLLSSRNVGEGVLSLSSGQNKGVTEACGCEMGT